MQALRSLLNLHIFPIRHLPIIRRHNTILQFIKKHKPVNHIISWYNWIKDVTYIHKSSLEFFIYIKNSYQTDKTDKSHEKEIL